MVKERLEHLFRIQRTIYFHRKSFLTFFILYRIFFIPTMIVYSFVPVLFLAAKIFVFANDLERLDVLMSYSNRSRQRKGPP